MPRITVAPIKAVAGASAKITLLDQKQRPIAVVLDLVNPALPARRLINECRELGFDKANAGHACYLAS
jgi:hypothetical protein